MADVLARLLDVHGAATYLGISPSTVRALIRRAILVPVQIPSCRGSSTSRRLLFDRCDLDLLVERWKLESSGEPNPQLSAASVKGWRSTPSRVTKRGAA